MNGDYHPVERIYLSTRGEKNKDITDPGQAFVTLPEGWKHIAQVTLLQKTTDRIPAPPSASLHPITLPAPLLLSFFKDMSGKARPPARP